MRSWRIFHNVSFREYLARQSNSRAICCTAYVGSWHKADLPKRLSLCPLSERSGHALPTRPNDQWRD
jgi:hypothetical protein